MMGFEFAKVTSVEALPETVVFAKIVETPVVAPAIVAVATPAASVYDIPPLSVFNVADQYTA